MHLRHAFHTPIARDSNAHITAHCLSGPASPPSKPSPGLTSFLLFPFLADFLLPIAWKPLPAFNIGDADADWRGGFSLAPLVSLTPSRDVLPPLGSIPDASSFSSPGVAGASSAVAGVSLEVSGAMVAGLASDVAAVATVLEATAVSSVAFGSRDMASLKPLTKPPTPFATLSRDDSPVGG